MRREVVWIAGVAIALVLTGGERIVAQQRDAAKINTTKVVADLTAQGELDAHAVKAEVVTYRGQKAVRITDDAPGANDDTSRMAVVHDISMQDGTVQMRISGDTVPNAPASLRGFVGIAFRVSADSSRYECIYLRPTNGRADDQLRRNHSTQYISVPGYPWEKLRTETPGVYESYVDLVPGEWTDVKIEFHGKEARLYVNGATQPALIVHDLKQPVTPGGIALWVGPGTLAHFADLHVTLP